MLCSQASVGIESLKQKKLNSMHIQPLLGTGAPLNRFFPHHFQPNNNICPKMLFCFLVREFFSQKRNTNETEIIHFATLICPVNMGDGAGVILNE